MKYLIFILFLSPHLNVKSQNLSIPSITGKVTNSKGEAISSAVIRCISQEGYLSFFILSDETGFYDMSLKSLKKENTIKDGDILECSHIGYKPKKEVIESNNTINFILEKNETSAQNISIELHGKKILYIKNKYDSLLEEKRQAFEGAPDILRRNFTFIQMPAEYPGGDDGFKKYLLDSIKIPDTINTIFSEKFGNTDSFIFHATIKIGFWIDKEGKLSNPNIIKGIFSELDENVIKTLNNCKRWKPMLLNGRAIEFYKELNLTFYFSNYK